MKTILREIVSALLISKDNKIFFGRKDPSQGGVYSDCWHIPGGGVDEGETKEETLHREILEEVGIDISSCKTELIDDLGQGNAEKILKETGEKILCEMHFNVYSVKIDTDAKDIPVKLESDLVEYQWVAINDLDSIKQTPPSKELLARFDINSLKQ